jgi:metallo-beta-lactamase family protein
MRISFHGAAQTVTGSQHLLEINGKLLLLECGMYQGRRAETYARNQNFSFKPSKIAAVILSHAHIDHSGNLPNLVKLGYTGPIYATHATARLADLMLRDSGHIQEKQAENLSHRNARRGAPPVAPLYTEEDAARVKDHLVGVAYSETFEPIPGVTARFFDAGHILGSASVLLEVEEKRRKIRLWFSGDIGRRNLPILRDPVLPESVDYLLMESTYGDKPHRDPELAFQEMRRVILRTLDRGGKVIIPSFAVGRTQEIVYNLNVMYSAGDLPAVPVFVDSPLAVNASDIFRKHPECYDDETLDLKRRGHPALDFALLRYVHSLEESKTLNSRKDPMIILSASGMAETGRVVYHIQYNIEDKRNTIMIVSWQAPETLGRRLADRERVVKIFGETYHREAEVATIGGLSAHAGQDLLLEYAGQVHRSAKGIFLIHGEPSAAQALQEKMAEKHYPPAYYPPARSSIEL